MENTTEIFDIEDAYINCGPSSDESKLITFLEERGLSSSYPYLKKSQVTFESLEYLTEDDIKEVITPLLTASPGEITQPRRLAKRPTIRLTRSTECCG
ncbi:hypothetical protein ACLKA7_011929 [Drosophila subpalustris]